MIWVYGFLGAAIPGLTPVQDTGPSLTLAELSTMAIPAGLALTVMYRLVPFHRLVYSLRAVSKEVVRRRKRREARELEQVVVSNEL